MVKCDEKSIVISGGCGVVMSEITTILHSFYEMASEQLGNEEANAMMVEMGRLAVMSDEEIEAELMSKLSAIFSNDIVN